MVRRPGAATAVSDGGSEKPGIGRRIARGLAVYRDRRMLLLFVLGFSSGLPLLLVGGTLRRWLREDGVSLEAIGLLAGVTLPYTLKPLWAPLIDRIPAPFLGRVLGQRRGWMAVAQVGLALSLLHLAGCAADADLTGIVQGALLVSFFAATQDIVVDAYRVDRLADDEQGAGAAQAVFGYRAAMLLAGAGAFYLAEATNWHDTYAVMSAVALVGLVATLICAEPDVDRQLASGSALAVARDVGQSLYQSVAGLVARPGAGWLLVLVMLYKLGDGLASYMVDPMLVDLNYSKTETANIFKIFGTIATITGGLAGGALVRSVGTVRALWLAGFLQLGSNFAYYVVAIVGHDLTVLTCAVAVENVCGGIGMMAFVAYMSGLSKGRYSATQYALLTAMASLLTKTLEMGSGWLAASAGYATYFVLTAVAASPGLVVLWYMQRRGIGLQPPAAPAARAN